MANAAENKGLIKGLVVFSGVAIVIAVLVFLWQYMTGGFSKKKNPPQISPNQSKNGNSSGDNPFQTTPPQYSNPKNTNSDKDWAKDDGSDIRSTQFQNSGAKETTINLQKAFKKGGSFLSPCSATKEVVAELLKIEKQGNGFLMLVGREYENLTDSTLSKDLKYYFFGGYKPCSNGDGMLKSVYGISIKQIQTIIDTLKNYKL